MCPVEASIRYGESKPQTHGIEWFKNLFAIMYTNYKETSPGLWALTPKIPPDPLHGALDAESGGMAILRSSSRKKTGLQLAGRRRLTRTKNGRR